MIGFQICSLTRRVDSRIVEAFRLLPVANVSDCMSRMTAGGAQLRPYHSKGVLAGPAFTVKTRPGDNLMIHKALQLAQPGDVIVVDGGGDVTNALIGELMVNTAIQRGLAGFVMNGAIRDVDAIGAGTFPVYAAGVTHRGPYKDGPGEINVPIALNGMVVNPGDLILGDADGLLCVPLADAETLLQATLGKQELEQVMMRDIKQGTLDNTWIDATLKRLGVEVAA
ncbi:RraA family protein [Pantoea sp. 18069]|uniref:RraA family protein n=1 Tax=Pantoea sp. 18069 TaxID=2681415 RepID=UPI0013576AE9|nr:RraA family protein [Pantoea sp. 18069]